jgi:glycosyltransferase involved in cell wall biosynthesis
MAVMNSNMLKDLVSIVIPCKNEEGYIAQLLYSLHAQWRIEGVKVYIADANSTDKTIDIINNIKEWNNTDIEIIQGGGVSFARNNGASLVNTPYILFIDADVLFFDRNAIRDAVRYIDENNLDLVTFKAKSYSADIRSKLAYILFNFFNRIMALKIPFATGAFFLTRTSTFRELGGFPEKYAATEDFVLSRMYSPKKFKILNHYYGQDDRRFKKMGYFGMLKYMMINFWNRNNPNYLDNTDNFEKYWK